MNRLNQHDIAECATRLQVRRQELLGQVRSRMHQADAPDELALLNAAQPREDAGGAEQLNLTELGLLTHELDELGALDGALARIAAGSYGTCATCGATISRERMLAAPTAALCLACQEESERRPGLPNARARGVAGR